MGLRKDGIRALAILLDIRHSTEALGGVSLHFDMIEVKCDLGRLGLSNSCFSIKGASVSLPAAVSSSESKEGRISMA